MVVRAGGTFSSMSAAGEDAHRGLLAGAARALHDGGRRHHNRPGVSPIQPALETEIQGRQLRLRLQHAACRPTRRASRATPCRSARGPSQIVVFATCAQVNTFQAYLPPKSPMIEEFYMINDTQGHNVHFRHGGGALAAFLDGSSAPAQHGRRHALPNQRQENSPRQTSARCSPHTLKAGWLVNAGWILDS